MMHGIGGKLHLMTAKPTHTVRVDPLTRTLLTSLSLRTGKPEPRVLGEALRIYHRFTEARRDPEVLARVRRLLEAELRSADE